MSATYVLRQTGPRRFEFTLRLHDGRVLLTSTAYSDKETALCRIDATRSLARNQKNYLVLPLENGLSYFVIRNARGEVLAQSETFPDAESRLKTMNLTKGASHGARREDQTGEE